MLTSPEPFLAIFSQKPSESAWFCSSQASKSGGAAKSRIGNSSAIERLVASAIERLGQEIHLLRVAGAGAEDQLAATGGLEGGDVLANGLGILGGAARDVASDLPTEPGAL